ncbi:hypothetical protein PsaNZ64_00275 [Pseudomonas syringae pv. actinidiae]|nr:hypothetical protein PsaNZ64_00275 [Pseudomonas syringae pv. actinidiae]
MRHQGVWKLGVIWQAVFDSHYLNFVTTQLREQASQILEIGFPGIRLFVAPGLHLLFGDMAEKAHDLACQLLSSWIQSSDSQRKLPHRLRCVTRPSPLTKKAIGDTLQNIMIL